MERRILLADDHPLIREGLQMAIRARHPAKQIDAVDSIEAAERLVHTHKDYGLLLLDYNLPDSNGFSGFFRLQHALGKTPIALISAHGDPSLIAAARAAGAAGFLDKAHTLDELAHYIDIILEGRTAFPEIETTQDDTDDLQHRIKSLSGAQMRVLSALASGHLNKQIAEDLELSEATVKAHLTAIFRKLGVNNRLQAMMAVRPLLDADGNLPRH